MISLFMINKKFKIGDSISLFLKGDLIVKGIVYIFGSIPVSRFYLRKNKITNGSHLLDDVYEDALVIIDDKNSDNLVVLTLEPNDCKLFIWNDVFDYKKDFNFKKINEPESLKIIHNEVILTEIPYQFK